MIYLLYALMSYLPFYLFIRFTLDSHVIIPLIQDAVAIFFSFIILGKSAVGKAIFSKTTALDRLLLLFLLINATMVFLTFIKSGSLFISFYHFRCYISGILMYFIVQYFISVKRINPFIGLLILSSFLVSIFYLYEWHSLNVVHTGYMQWTKNYNNYVITHRGIKGGISAAWFYIESLGGQTYRLAGLIGHNHATGTFMAFAPMVIAAKMWYKTKSSFRWINCLIFATCFSGMLMSFSRTPLISFVISYCLLGYIIPKKNTLLLGRHILYFVIVIFVLLSLASMIGLWTFTYVYFGFIAKEIEVYSLIVSNHLDRLFETVLSNPLTFFAGAGFYTNENVPDVWQTVESDDLCLVTFFSQYGLIGMSVLGLIVIRLVQYTKLLLRSDIASSLKANILGALGVIVLILLTMVHSGVIRKFPVYYWLFSSMALVNICYRELVLKKSKHTLSVK